MGIGQKECDQSESHRWLLTVVTSTIIDCTGSFYLEEDLDCCGDLLGHGEKARSDVK